MAYNYQIYNKLYKLISNPKTKDLKIKAYESLIYDAFVSNKGRTTLNEIVKLAEEKFGIHKLSRLLVTNILEKLYKDGKIEKRGDNYILKEDVLENVIKKYRENEESYQNFVNHILSYINDFLEEQLNIEERRMVEGLLQRTFFEIFQRYTDNIIQIYGGKTAFVPLPQLEEIINKVFQESIIDNMERKISVQEAFLSALKELLYYPTEIFSMGLRSIANKHLLYKMIIKDPPTEKIKEDLFKNAVLFIDTNILVSYLCSGSQMHDITVNLIEETKKLGSQVFVSNWTIMEFHKALSHAKHLYELFKKGKIQLSSIENEILKTFLEMPDKITWDEFIRDLSVSFKYLEKEGRILKKDCEDDDIKEKARILEKLISKELATINIERHPSLISHDAKMIAYIQNKRRKESLTIGTFWFLTRDYRLKEIEKRNLQKLDYKFESIMTCDIWFEIILPFLSAEVDEKEISMAFSKMLAAAILPVPFDIIERFIWYLETSIDLPKEDEETLKRLLEESHIRQAVEKAMVEGNVQNAYRVILYSLEEKLKTVRKEKEYKEIINRLTSKVRLLEKTPPAIIFDKEKFKELKTRMIKAKTPDEKGKTLEEIVCYLMECINGIEIVERRIRLEAEEIDILLSNGAFFYWGDPIIVECKNWITKVGSNEIKLFKQKMKDLACQTGIFVTSAGITGDAYKDAKLVVREALLEKLRIVIITWEDIDKIENGDDWLNILKNRYYLPQKFALS